MSFTAINPRADDFLEFSDGPINSSDVLCVVCQSEVEARERCITHKRCKQSYHQECLERWACAAQRTPKPCPHCRGDLGPYMSEILARTGSSVEPDDPQELAHELAGIPDTDGPVSGNSAGEWVAVADSDGPVSSDGSRRWDFVVRVPRGMDDAEILQMVQDFEDRTREQPRAREQPEFEERAPTSARSRSTRQPDPEPNRMHTVAAMRHQPSGGVTPRAQPPPRTSRDMPPNSFFQAFSGLNFSTRSRRPTGSRLNALPRERTTSPRPSGNARLQALNRLYVARGRLLNELDDVNDQIDRLTAPTPPRARSPIPYFDGPSRGIDLTNTRPFNPYHNDPPLTNYRRSPSTDVSPRDTSFMDTLRREANQLRSLRERPGRRHGRDQPHWLDDWDISSPEY